MPGTYMMRIQRKAEEENKKQDINEIVFEGIMAQDILIANASEEIKFDMPRDTK